MPLRHLLSITTLLIVLLVGAAGASAQDATTVPSAPPAVAVAGTTVAGVDISGLDVPAALATVNMAFHQPILIRIEQRLFQVTNGQLGMKFEIEAAIAEAVARTVAGNTPVAATYSDARLTQHTNRIIRLSGSKGHPSYWVLGRVKPRLDPGKAGLAPAAKTIERQIRAAITVPALRPEQPAIPLVEIKPEITLAELGYVITVSKEERLLRLYAPVKGKVRVVLKFRVAVGAPSFPTPSGRFEIVSMRKDPWWTPPASPWAEGLEPVPPGPGNPLGTRWMGLDRDDVGIHGTPETGSLGNFASHGCIRLYIPSAEKLYSLVTVGTLVLIS